MITVSRGYVGVAPGTTTLYIPGRRRALGDEVVETVDPGMLTYEEYLARDIALRQEALEVQKRGDMWSRIGTFATASLTTLALLAAVGAWWRTGKLRVTR